MDLNKMLSDDQIEECRTFYVKYENEDNRINIDVTHFLTENLISILKEMKLQVSEEEMRISQESVDIGEHYFIDFPEFITIIARKMLQTDIEDQIKELYSMFDSKKNGYITAGDMKSVLIGLNPKITDEQVDSIVTEADKDGDGVITYEEFVYLCIPK